MPITGVNDFLFDSFSPMGTYPSFPTKQSSDSWNQGIRVGLQYPDGLPRFSDPSQPRWGWDELDRYVFPGYPDSLSPIRGLPKDPPFPRSGEYPSRSRLEYPPDWTETDFDQGVPSRRIASPPTSPTRAAAKSAAAATKAAPRPGGFDLNSPRGILLPEGLGFGLGGAMSGGFALQAGATPSQALGIAGASVAGDAVGSGLGILAGLALSPFLGPAGATFIRGAVPFATRMIGGTIGSIAGDRWGWKATGAEDTVNRKFQEQQMQQQPMYDPQTGQQYMAPPPPPTPEEKLRQQILSAGSNPYLPYMMTGGF